MKKLIIAPITINDINSFDDTEYSNLSNEKRIELINNSQEESIDGKFFKFYKILHYNNVVGFLNFYEQSKSVISIAPYIKENFRQKGFAYSSIIEAHKIVKSKGFKIALQTVRENNVASIKLHEKLGFELVKKCVSNNNNAIRLYLKIL